MIDRLTLDALRPPVLLSASRAGGEGGGKQKTYISTDLIINKGKLTRFWVIQKIENTHINRPNY